MASHKYFILALFFVVLGTSCPGMATEPLASDHPSKSTSFVDCNFMGNNVVFSQLSLAHTRISETLHSEGKATSAEELQTLDFSGAQDVDHKVSVLHLMQGQKIVSQSCLDKLTTQPGTKLIFNLRRHVSSQTHRPVVILYAIIPNLRECPSSYSMDGRGCYVNEAPYSAGGKFTIAPDNHQIVDDSDFPSSDCRGGRRVCVKMPDGSNYFFEPLIVSSKP